MPKHLPLIIANWKMNASFADAMVLTNGVRKSLEDIRHIEVSLAPPLVWLYPMHEIISRHPLRHLSLAAQNMSQFEEGAHTGEVSASMLSPMCRYVLIGHSERERFKEDEESINLKIKLALDWKLTPIVFLSQNEKEVSATKITDKVRRFIQGIPRSDFDRLVFVFEPVWAISTSRDSQPVNAGDLEEAIYILRQTIGPESRILYGGSVKADNAERFVHIQGLDGMVVGDDSLKLKNFIKICQLLAEGREA